MRISILFFATISALILVLQGRYIRYNKGNQKEIDLENKEYQPQLAYKLAALCGNTYCSTDVIQSWKCGKYCDKYKEMVDVKAIHNLESEIQAYTAYDSKLKAIVVVFRGTLHLSGKNWMSNLQIQHMDYEVCQGCQIHKGFYLCYDSIKQELMQNIDDLRKKYNNPKIILTGHSLGGAIATILSGDLVQLGINDIIHYNFGSPRVGNQAFIDWLQHVMKYQIYRITHNKDPVVHLPLSIMGYSHIAQEIHYNKNPKPDAPYTICNGSGEDNECADQHVLFTPQDHNTYMGYNFTDYMKTCNRDFME